MSERSRLLLPIGATSGEVYNHVVEVMANPLAMQGKRLQVHGHVVQPRLVGNRTEVKFKIQNNGNVIDAPYLGVIPDKEQPGNS